MKNLFHLLFFGCFLSSCVDKISIHAEVNDQRARESKISDSSKQKESSAAKRDKPSPNDQEEPLQAEQKSQHSNKVSYVPEIKEDSTDDFVAEPANLNLEIEAYNRVTFKSGDGEIDAPFIFEVHQDIDPVGYIRLAIDSSEDNVSIGCSSLPSWVNYNAEERKLEISGSYIGISNLADSPLFSCKASIEDLEKNLYFKIPVRGHTQIEIRGSSENERIGSYLKAADLNGDGHQDLIFSFYSSEGKRQYKILFGSPFRDLKSVQNLEDIPADRLVTLYGNTDLAGSFQIMDANKDGMDDLVFYRYGTNCLGTSRAYVLFGKEGSWPASIDLYSGFDGTTKMLVTNTNGCPKVFFEDFDNDGYVDILMAHYYNIKLKFGRATPWPSTVDMSSGSTAFSNNQGGAHMGFGYNVGDISGDGIPEIILGTTQPVKHFIFLGGSSIWGNAGSRPSTVSTESLDGSNGFRIDSPLGIGHGVGRPVDLNNDGILDLVGSGSRTVSTGGSAGSVMVFFGRETFSASYGTPQANSLILLDGDWIKNERTFKGFYSGVDFNGDGKEDFCFRGDNHNKIFCFFGKEDWSSSIYSTANLNGTDGFKIDLGNASLKAIGDYNRNGKTDFIFGDTSAGVGGALYMLWGRALNLLEYTPFRNLSSDQGFSVIAPITAGLGLGTSVSMVDFDGDGKEDLIFGVPNKDHGASEKAGSLIIHFGENIGEDIEI